ncbi:hypothetical protein RJ639_030476 [Escallonia herrerae]|uniref:Retrovirus-related Pol polyprotein from transposon TNT 1-94 n=1 Tax=Escallonia herrerae TaxID=1293975 RepID=A0AA89BDV2_9ASTE|nr:hypothetical protein RJ639_030476 [Escallonia herrerae]
MWRKTIGDGISSSTALSEESRGRQNNRGRSPTKGRSRSRSRGKSKSKGKTIVCWNCNKEGHKKNDCTEPKKKKGAGGRQGDDEGANMVSSNKRTYDDLCLSATVDDNSKVWLDREGYFVAFDENSGRLGHLSESGMKILHSKNALPGMKNIQLDFCEGCVYGKQKQISFQKDGKERKTERLELVHTDVCGPTAVKSLGGNFYFVSFIDDASRKTGYMPSNRNLMLIRTVKRTPQENGLVERMNRTIMERARCMRIHADLPLQFWAAAVDTVVYLINRSSSSALNGGIPEEEEWSGKPVNYFFLRVFGCSAYAHIDKKERKKLDSKSQKCVFIGYGGDEYGYRL